MREEDIQRAYSIERLSGFVVHNGIQVVQVADDHCTVRADLTSQGCNIYGVPHGGLLFTLADTAVGALFQAHGYRGVTVDASISYLRAAKESSFVSAVSRVIREGRELCFYDVAILDDQERQIAVARVTMKQL